MRSDSNPVALVRPIFHAGSQLRKVRFAMLLALAGAIAAVPVGVHIVRTYGLREADGGMLRPLPVRLAFGLGVGLIGVSFAAGMALFGRRYVARLEFDEATREYHVHTVRWLGLRRRVLPREAFGRGRYHDGHMRGWWAALGPAVEAPWWTLPLRGRRIPLVLDAQGVVHDEGLLRDLVALNRTSNR